MCGQTTYCIAESLKSVAHKNDLFYYVMKRLCTYPFKINSVSCETLFQRVILTNRKPHFHILEIQPFFTSQVMYIYLGDFNS